MEQLTFKATTWVCEDTLCPFKWQFDGAALGTSPHDLTQEQVAAIFPTAPGLLPGQCLRCYRYGRISNLYRENNDANMSDIVVVGDAELESHLVEELDDHGQPIMEESGEVRYQFDPITGQVTPVAVLVPKMRCLTTQELAELKQQRDQNLDQLESIAVKEV